MSVLSQIRASLPYAELPVSSVYYGYNTTVDVRSNPFITLTDFSSTFVFDTSGPVIRESTYKVHVYANTLEETERLAGLIYDALNGEAVTPTTIEHYCEEYKVMQEDLYVFHVEQSFRLKESPVT